MNTYVFYTRHGSRHCSVCKDIQEETLTFPKVQVCLKEQNIFKGKSSEFFVLASLNMVFKRKKNIQETPLIKRCIHFKEHT